MLTGRPVQDTAEAVLWRNFSETLAACTRQVDGFHLTLQTALKLGAAKGAICIADPALGGKLVVRLSAGFEGASNKVLSASAPGRTAAMEAHAQNKVLVVPDFTSVEYSPTDLEARLAITGAAYFPIASEGQGPLGLLIAVPSPDTAFEHTALGMLEQIAATLGKNLARLSAGKPFALTLPAETHELPPGLFEAFRQCLNTPNIDELSAMTLEQCRRFTDSEFGFVGYLEPATGFLICPTMTRDIFAQCKVEGKTVVFEKAGGLGGWVLDQRAPLVTNDPAAHPASVGTPPGHLPIRKFMGVPCFSQSRIMGMIALANKDSDYTEHDLRIVTAFADIYAAAVARFLSEQELTASRNRLSSLYNDAPCGYDTLAPDGTIIEANDTALKMLGHEPGEVIGRLNITTLLTSTGKNLLADQLREIGKGNPVAPVELHLRRPDGTRLPVLHSVSANHDERGFLRDIRCTLVDLSLRKVLRQTRDYLETLFNYSASPIVVWDAHGNITRFNRAVERLSGYRYADVVGRPLGMLFPEDERENLLAKLEMTNSGIQLNSAELPLRTADGRRRTILWNSSNLYSEDGSELLATVVLGVDITERKAYELALRKTNRALKTLSRGNEALVHASSETELLDRVCQILVEEGDYRLAWIGYLEGDAQDPVHVVSHAGAGIDCLNATKTDPGDGLPDQDPVQTALRTGLAQVFRDAADCWPAGGDTPQDHHSHAAFPLKHGDHILGVLALYGSQSNRFDKDEMRLLNELVNDLAFGIVTLRTEAERRKLEKEREHNLQHLKESMEATIQAIAATIEKRDPYTAGHQQRVARLAVAVATEMGLPPDQIEGIHFGGLIHDIGKISVPAEILSKPGALAPVEFQIIKAHVEVGREILAGVRFPWPIIDMVYEHHERMDGSGYPRGLTRDQIRLEARIIGVADVVEAMSSFRPYRPALGIEKAMDEITRNSGRLYDPDAVAACLTVLRSGFSFDA